MVHLPNAPPTSPHCIACAPQQGRHLQPNRGAALVAYAAPPNSSAASRRDVRGGHAERSHFQLFLNRKLGAGGGVVVCVCRVGSHVSEEMWWRFELTVASFAVVLWQRGPPEHCKQYQIRVHKKIAMSF